MNIRALEEAQIPSYTDVIIQFIIDSHKKFVKNKWKYSTDNIPSKVDIFSVIHSLVTSMNKHTYAESGRFIVTALDYNMVMIKFQYGGGIYVPKSSILNDSHIIIDLLKD